MKPGKDTDATEASFGELLRSCRRQSKWTQERLGNSMNPKRNKHYIHKLETNYFFGRRGGKPPLTVTEICDIALALGIHPVLLLSPFFRMYGVHILIKEEDGSEAERNDRYYTLAVVLAMCEIDPSTLKEFVIKHAPADQEQKKGPG